MRLVMAEVRRGLARRSTRLLVALACALIALTGVLVFADSSAADPRSPDGLAAASRARAADVRGCATSNGFGGEISASPGQSLGQACELHIQPVDDYVRDKRFRLTSLWDDRGDDSVLGFIAIFLVIGGLIGGATFIGGEWRFGTVGTWLTWEPRRMRVFFSKAAAVLLVSFGILVLLQILVCLALWPSAIWRGTTAGADREWLQSLGGGVFRSALLGAGAAVVGYAIASLGRNTSAALGVVFAYFAIVEPIVRGQRPRWQRWLIGDNATVMLLNGDNSHVPFERTLTEASLILVLYLGVVLAVAACGFARRDVAA